jgi:hypothetical protein
MKPIWLIFVLLFPSILLSQTTDNAPDIVQSCVTSGASWGGGSGCTGTNSSTTTTTSFSDNVVTGNKLIVYAQWGGNTGMTTSVTDTCGSTWTLRGGRQNATSGGANSTTELWDADAACTGANTITFHKSASLTLELGVAEFSPPTGRTLTFDTSCTATGTVAASASTSCTTTQDGDLIFTFAGSTTPSNSFLAAPPENCGVGTGGGFMTILCWKLSANAGTVTSTISQNTVGSPSHAWNMVTLAYKPSAILITTTAIADGAQSNFYKVCLAAIGGSGPYTWSATSGLPAWATVNSGDSDCTAFGGGSVTGTPNVSATNSVTFQVTDGTNTTTTTLPLTTGNSFATPALLQTANNHSAPFYVTFASPVGKGDLIRIVASGQQASGAYFALLGYKGTNAILFDTLGTVWHRVNPVAMVPGPGTSTNGSMVETFVGCTTVAGADTIKFTQNGAVQREILAVEDWSGVQCTVDPGTYVSLAGQAADPFTPTTPNLKTLVANEMLMDGSSASNTNTITLSSPFTVAVPQFNTSGVPLITGYDQATTAGNYTSSASWTSTIPHPANITLSLYGFRPAVASSTSTPVVHHRSMIN